MAEQVIEQDKQPSVREWAKANGHEVKDTGRLSAKVREAYAAAHPEYGAGRA